MKFKSFLLVSMSMGLFGACTTAELAVDLAKKYNRTQQEQAEASTVTEVKSNPIYKVGNPYQVEGKWYYPERDLNYDETGIASWYGDEFGGRLTANGEIFDPALVSAAHKTLPMPSVVRVTNFDNGRSLVVRVNDRGPFVAGRIIDLSREAARLLGFKDKGIARVRVEILTEESLRLEKLARAGQFPLLSADNEPLPQVTAAKQPSVSLSAKTTNSVARKPAASQSSVALLSQSRAGTIIQTDPVQTSLWVQIGAFHSEQNAVKMLEKISSISDGRISESMKNGRTLYRVQLGPIENAEQADTLLNRALQQGYNGARTIVD